MNSSSRARLFPLAPCVCADSTGQVATLRRERRERTEQLANVREDLAAAKRQLAAGEAPASEADLNSKIDHLRSEVLKQSSSHAGTPWATTCILKLLIITL